MEGAGPAPPIGDRRRPTTSTTSGRRRALVLCLLALPVLLGSYAVLLWWSAPHSAGRKLRVDEYLTLLREGRVRSAILVEPDDRITGAYDGGQYWVALASGRETMFARVTQAVEEAGVAFSVRQQPLKELVAPASVILPTLVVLDGLFVLFLAFGRNGEAVAAFGRSKARRLTTGESTVTFADVAGVDEAVEELAEVRDYLASSERFRAVGAAVPKGILLTGPPGCGKTLLARALAGESQVPFFSISGPDFVELFVGVGAARIRDLFETAKAAAPCIVFIDELDAVGRGRTVSAVGGQDEREAALNQLLVEMDGFESGTGVVVLAATNRPDILDTALLRPGRFDRQVVVERPDVRGREAVLQLHARGKPLAPDVDLGTVARRTAGFSGADLANVLNEAALLAARRSATSLDARLVSEAIDRVVAGPERHTRVLSPQDRHRIAHHEAGHAVVATALPGTDRVGKLSIVARGHAGGFTWWMSDGDAAALTRSQLLDRVAAILGGRAAEMVVTGETSSGAEADLAAAGLLARRMVLELGMGERVGPFTTGAAAGVAGLGDAGVSERMASQIDADIQAVLAEAERRASAALAANRPTLDAVALALLEVESLDGETLDGLLLPVTADEVPSPLDA